MGHDEFYTANFRAIGSVRMGIGDDLRTYKTAWGQWQVSGRLFTAELNGFRFDKKKKEVSFDSYIGKELSEHHRLVPKSYTYGACESLEKPKNVGPKIPAPKQNLTKDNDWRLTCTTSKDDSQVVNLSYKKLQNKVAVDVKGPRGNATLTFKPDFEPVERDNATQFLRLLERREGHVTESGFKLLRNNKERGRLSEGTVYAFMQLIDFGARWQDDKVLTYDWFTCQDTKL